MAGPASRSPTALALIIAIPVALVAGVVAFAVLSRAPSGSPPPRPESWNRASAQPANPTPVPMEAPTLTDRDAATCRDLVAHLPAAIGGVALPRRPVTAGAEQNAAFGDPAVLLACGGPVPTPGPVDQVFPASGVCWHATQTPDSTVWTPMDRELAIRVTVPQYYDSPYQLVIDLSPAIMATTRRVGNLPGCQT
ncbi:MAG: DUF3515 family protein [Micromonosporaceae bacterium]